MRLDKDGTHNLFKPEVLFQVVLHMLLFLYYISARQYKISLPDVVFFINYAFAAWVISYRLIPLLFYKKKFLLFFTTVFIVLNLVMAVEEFVLEKIFYPNAQGSQFPGYFYTLFEYLPLITILVGFKFAWDAHIKQRKLEQISVAAKTSELQFLKSQINPHFLFNNLNNLYSYAIQQSAKTPSIILELSSVLRYMLYDCQEDYVPLNKEIEHLKSYITLNKLHIEERGRVTFITPEWDTTYKIAPLILIVFIENAFKHSASSQIDGVNINIKIDVSKEGMLDFKCVNNYSIMNNQHNIKGGIGLTNIKKRLGMLYPENHWLTIDQQNNLYSVFLKINLSQNK